MRFPAKLALLLLLLPLPAAFPAVAAGDEAGPRTPLALGDAPGLVTPPEGEWKKRSGAAAPGQWFVEFQGADEALLRAHVFPAQETAEPEKVLVQAADVFFRGIGVQGFGLPTRRELLVWGCPAAEGSMVAMLRGVRIKGRARLVRVSEAQWAVALGIAPETAPLTAHDAVHAFVRSLEPVMPRFYERRFHHPVKHEVVVVRKPEEEPVTVGHLASVQALLEAGIGSRFPLALWPRVRKALQADAEQGPPRTRQGFRDAAELLQEALKLEAPKRDATLKSMGRRIQDAILARAQEGYAPAVQFAFAWREMRRLSIGEAEDGLTTGDVAHLVEASEFLASIAADRVVVADGEARKRLHGRLVKRWPDLPAEERKALRAAGDLWAALRYAWDNAAPEARLKFRFANAYWLAPAPKDPEAALEPRNAREVKLWMEERPKVGDTAVLDAAFDLDTGTRRTLIDMLGVEDSYALHFGW